VSGCGGEWWLVMVVVVFMAAAAVAVLLLLLLSSLSAVVKGGGGDDGVGLGSVGAGFTMACVKSLTMRNMTSSRNSAKFTS
jgi:hypothetical protein